MTIRIKRLALALGLLAVIVIAVMACNTSQPGSAVSMEAQAGGVSGTFGQCVIENGMKWVMQTAYKFLQIR